MVTDIEILANIMRKFLSSETEYVDYAATGARFRGPAWLRIDGRLELTDEEYAAVERAGQP